MKLVDRFQLQLQNFYEDCFVVDERGDGHFVQVICLDDAFEGKNLLARSRAILKNLGDLQKQVHAISVKGFTRSEWEVKKDGFELVKYEHYGR